jgi:riboflavin synthase alpha subunit
MGTVSAVSGSMITVTDHDGGTYTVDASSATVKASGTASTLGSVKVGDTVMIHGKVTTASMTAQDIEDGIPTPPAGAPTGAAPTGTVPSAQ